MKRVLSILLTAALLMTAFSVTVFAQEDDWTNKLSYYLKQMIENTDPDDTIGISIVFADSEPEDTAGILENLGIEDVRYISGKNPYAIVNVACKQISGIAQSPYVSGLQIVSALESGDGKTFRYADRFLGYLGEGTASYGYYLDIWLEQTYYLVYDELYYHTDANGETDWVLLKAWTGACGPWIYTTLIGNRVIQKDGWDDPFTTDYGLYDVKNDVFIDINNENMHAGWQEFNPGDYPGFAKVFDEIAAKSTRFMSTRLLGDLDLDGEISVIDVTLIQRCQANMADYPEDDDSIYLDTSRTKKPAYYSDFNRDGERDIIDATAIQRWLVNA